MDVIIGTLALLLLMAAGVAVLAVRALVKSLQGDRNYLRERVTDLERSLASHSWQDYAQISQQPTPLARAATAPLNGWGEPRSEEAYGESAEDTIEAYFAANGVDLEGPTVG